MMEIGSGREVGVGEAESCLFVALLWSEGSEVELAIDM